MVVAVAVAVPTTVAFALGSADSGGPRLQLEQQLARRLVKVLLASSLMQRATDQAAGDVPTSGAPARQTAVRYRDLPYGVSYR